MDSIQIGRFIAETRKQHHLTQRQLADALGISDKTVSKWECGKGLPEVSLMLPLCEELEISVNDLLAGERVTEPDYRKKAEENMMGLMKDREESRKKLVVSVIGGVITVIAVIALVLLAAYLELPAAVRIGLIVLSAVTAGFGIAGAIVLDREAGAFECPYCGERFVPNRSEYIKGAHTFTKRRLTCPSCGKTGMCRHRTTR